MGDNNSAKANMFVIRFEMCVGDASCKDEAVIKEWIKRKFILTLVNHAEFNKE